MDRIIPRAVRPLRVLGTRLALVAVGAALLSGCIPPPPRERPPAGTDAGATSSASATPSLPPMLGPSSTGALHARLTQTAALIGNANVPRTGGQVMLHEAAVDVIPAVVGAGTGAVLRVTVVSHATIPTVDYLPGGKYTCAGNDRSKLGWGLQFGVVFGSLADLTRARLAFYPVTPAKAAVLPTGHPSTLLSGTWRVQGQPVRTVSADACSETIDRTDVLEFTVPPTAMPAGHYLVVPWDPIAATGYHIVNGKQELLAPAALGAVLVGTLPQVTVTQSAA